MPLVEGRNSWDPSFSLSEVKPAIERIAFYGIDILNSFDQFEYVYELLVGWIMHLLVCQLNLNKVISLIRHVPRKHILSYVYSTQILCNELGALL